MSQLLVAEIDFQIVKGASGAGSSTAYRKDKRRVTAVVTSFHPKDVVAVLASNLTLGTGESIEVLAVRPAATPGTEGNLALA